MTATQVKTTIKTTLAAELPAKLAAASLDDFEDYLATPPTEAERRQIGIYIADEEDSTDFHSLSILIQAQIYKKPDGEQKYHSVIMDTIREFITADLVGFTTRTRIIGDCYPVDRKTSTLNFYQVEFETDLDDCDD